MVLEDPKAAVIPGCNRLPSDSLTEVFQVEAEFQIQDSAQPPGTSECGLTHLVGLPSPQRI
jgi:hypothetical protein